MLKITISASLLKTVSSAAMSVGAEAAIQQKEHPFLISKEKRSLERQAKMLDKTVEEVIKDNKEWEIKYPTKSLLERLPLISNIKDYADKVFNVSRTDEEVTIGINETFITEAIEIGTRVAVKAMKPGLDLAAVMFGYAQEVNAYKAKWEEDKPTDDVEISSETIAAEQVPETIRNKVQQDQDTPWTAKLDDHPSKPVPFFIDADKEKYVSILDLVWTRGDETFHVSPTSGAYMLGNVERTIPELAEYNNIPASLVRAVYAHYNINFTNKQLGIEEVAPTVQETIQKAFDNATAETKE